MSIAPVNTRLIVHTSHCCPRHYKPSVLSAVLDPSLSHGHTLTEIHTHAGKETNECSQSDGYRLKNTRSTRHISHTASCCFGPGMWTLAHSQQTVYTGNEANPSPDVHTHGRHRHLHSSPAMILTFLPAGHCSCCDGFVNALVYIFGNTY